MAPIDLSPELQAVVKHFRTGELSTLAKNGTPITWPTTPLYQAEKGRFLITTSIGMPEKAFNIRRNPKVSLLFSDPTACGLVDPPAVLFQGNAEVPENITTWSDEIEELAWILSKRQRARGKYSSNPVTRYLFDWYRCACVSILHLSESSGGIMAISRLYLMNERCTMWDEVAKYIEYFPSAVLSWVDEEGYPYSVRCKPLLDSSDQVIRVLISEHTGIQPGPAGMLCHKHDEWLWNLKSFTLRGTIEKDDLGWLFHPKKFIPGLGIEGPLQLIRSIRDARRNASQYLKRRGLDRPRIPWDKLAEVEMNEFATHRVDR